MNASPLDAATLTAAWAAAAAHLAEQAPAIDAINVYPVPDGDTGSNMAATLREAVDHARAAAATTVAGVLDALARGALYGARGNSGVILSQALRGFASAVSGETLDAAATARALDGAARAAYAAVATPVEGTMLTVLRSAARGAAAFVESLPAQGNGQGCIGTLQAAIEAAERAEAETPDLLPQLAEAGVTDSGGEGICVILRGLWGALAGAHPPAAAIPDRPIASLAGHEAEEYGFCTEFVLEPEEGMLDIDAVRRLAAAHRSAVVVGDERALRVHLHTDDPEAVFAAAGRLGRVGRAKAEDMTAQHSRFRATGTGAGARIAVLALTTGPGFDQVFESLGAHPMRLVDIVKPAAGDIAAAANALGVPDVIVLPNHKNVIMAARQAAGIARCSLSVVPTRSLPQGIAAAVAFDPAQPLDVNVEEMDEAAGQVVTIEVTVAAADRNAEGISVRAGEAIALINDRLVGKAAAPLDALVGALNRLADDGEGLITIYGGADISSADLERARTLVAGRFPGATVEAVEGGQPLYPFIASIER